ncbi:sugar ABC transporter ATP-binding protein [Oscillatoria amoena NRMC-F 0135]|nr:sugar ABC transporter ATP-binding protein [Oscillatoria laete-virens]MDL5049122.1 sugar ABC transporter ATP-binding protein [Oscillatoria amoena NRMC-F 0135]MDL5053994.1 sugar ABC transporter ATP-binding protein [Oscillatoria laete-virens NRMC-F 0139]
MTVDKEDSAASSPLLEARGMTKAFGHTQALTGTNLTLGRGEILCLIGENGAGKSTLMKILGGGLRADAGMMTLEGKSYSPTNPHAALRAGVSMVYQELSLAPHLTVEENLCLGMEPHRLGFINHKALSQAAGKLLAQFALPESMAKLRVRDISPATRQLVEVARAILWNPKLLVLDEPTSSLGTEESAKLFEVMNDLRQKGVSIIYISHFLEECLRIGDRCLVMRDGRDVHTGPIQDTNEKVLISHMVGRQIDEVYPRTPHLIGETILTVSKMSGSHNKPRDASVELRAGEILGIAGLVGAGRTEFLRVLFGLDRMKGGWVAYEGRRTGQPTAADQVRAGFGFLSENRKEEGLMLERSIQDNVMLPSWGRFAKWGWIDSRKSAQIAREKCDALNTKHGGMDDPISSLSGGNQQKAAIARLLAQEARVYLLDEPTRGIDINSKIEIYRLIGELAAQGKSVILVSSYLPELFGVCDTLCVMSRGRLGAKKEIQEWTPHGVIQEALKTI